MNNMPWILIAMSVVAALMGAVMIEVRGQQEDAAKLEIVNQPTIRSDIPLSDFGNEGMVYTFVDPDTGCGYLVVVHENGVGITLRRRSGDIWRACAG